MLTAQSIDVSKAREKLSRLMEMVYFQKLRFIIERQNIPMVALIPVDELVKIESGKVQLSEKEVKQRLAAVERISKIGLKVGDDWEKVEKEITKAHIPHL